MNNKQVETVTITLGELYRAISETNPRYSETENQLQIDSCYIIFEYLLKRNKKNEKN